MSCDISARINNRMWVQFLTYLVLFMCEGVMF